MSRYDINQWVNPVFPFLNAVWFQGVWFIAVLAPETSALLFLFSIFLHLTLSYYFLGAWRRDILVMLLVASIGILIDATLAQLGYFTFYSQQIMPLFLVMIWLHFAIALNYSLVWLNRLPMIWLALLGAVVGSANYFAASKLGAVSFDKGVGITLTIVGTIWLISLVLFMMIQRKVSRFLPVSSTLDKPVNTSSADKLDKDNQRKPQGAQLRLKRSLVVLLAQFFALVFALLSLELSAADANSTSLSTLSSTELPYSKSESPDGTNSKSHHLTDSPKIIGDKHLITQSSEQLYDQSMLKVGETTFRWFIFKIYKVKLYSLSGRYLDQPSNQQWPLKLNIRYYRSIDSEDLVDATLDQWQVQKLSHPNQVQWLEKLNTIFPDVSDGDEITLIIDKQGKSHFYYNGVSIGQVLDSEFSQHFIDIWLSSQTPYKTLRSELVGGR
ncbi:DUF2878 family protein [Vibrio sp. SS-MA-C1-2]|uniref:DUF2878 family protein n=1 Tax=Vibrio sp. SS-MA-C1-2 TaxID=2908646 RepID=UPI001F2BB159|nr:DUF2878 family protein [Vibrio sp. SS-MA-C1-2]UJF18361.1 DUF2878 family protein [Vibrio sp. SS-MA-C1-2]